MKAGERKKVKMFINSVYYRGVYIDYRRRGAVQCQASKGYAESLDESYFSRNKPVICNGQAIDW